MLCTFYSFVDVSLTPCNSRVHHQYICVHTCTHDFLYFVKIIHGVSASIDVLNLNINHKP